LRWLGPFKFLSRNQWRSKDMVSQLTTPILFLAGEKDELVPFPLSHFPVFWLAIG
jgi:pimeloyl-ACP methyl ester carboxylesterase